MGHRILRKIYLLIFTCVIMVACSGPNPAPYTLSQQLVAHPAGFDNVRFFADALWGDLEEYRSDFLPKKHAGRPSYLALSGGGEAGAFGAGLLVGWTEQGSRPDFDLVTGVSAGSLIAPFAFAGSTEDKKLAQLFSSGIATQLNARKSFLSGLLSDSLFQGAPLRKLISDNLDPELMARIAKRHREGARLLVVTTNIDAERSVVWNMGAIAASGKPGAQKLFGDVLAASASIPGIFPPTLIETLSGETPIEELHVDGGAIRSIYFFPDNFLVSPRWGSMSSGTRPRIFAIVNHEIAPRFQTVADRSLSIAEEAEKTLTKSSIIGSVMQTQVFSKNHGMPFKLAYIDKVIPSNSKKPFDPAYMKTAFELGHEIGITQRWKTGVPLGNELLQLQVQ